MKDMPDNSVDAIVTDPPYGLSFMGKKWDYDVPSQEIWEECLRVLKPGGYLLSFAGTRTQHRMAVRIEDAGFEIRDMIAWIYGSGFPKSLNIGKSVDKIGNRVKELHNFTKWFDELCIGKDLTNKQIDEFLGLESGGSTASHYRGWDTQQPRYPRENHYKRLKEWLGFGDVWDEKIAEVERELVGVQEKAMSGWNTDGSTKFIDRDITKGTSEWEGWGTSLKPALEPITVARKPIEGNVAQNCLKWGVGGINIDESRVALAGEWDKGTMGTFRKAYDDPDKTYDGTKGNVKFGGDKLRANRDVVEKFGRFPANLIHDGSDEVVGLFPNTKSQSGKKTLSTSNIYGGNSLLNSKTKGTDEISGYDDSGSAARFFYCAKASKSERNRGLDEFEPTRHADRNIDDGVGGDNPRNRTNTPKKNFHPTVKPVALMEYLVKLVSKEGHTVLDPFMGSGSTGIACKKLNREFIGIEKDADYCKIAEARIGAVQSVQEELL